jgi:hypothetical protein
MGDQTTVPATGTSEPAGTTSGSAAGTTSGTQAGATSTAASTGTVLDTGTFAKGFSTRGRCTAALAKARTSQRKAATTASAAATVDQTSATTTRCEKRGARYQAVYYESGLPG